MPPRRRNRKSVGLGRKAKTADTSVDKTSTQCKAPTETAASYTSTTALLPSVTSESASGRTVTLPPPAKRGGSVKPKSGRAKKAAVGKKKSSRNAPLPEYDGVCVSSAPKSLSVGPSCTATLKLARSIKRESDSDAELDRDLYCCNESDD